jgi:hypothetical protein
MTPEGKVKAKVKRVLDQFAPHVYGHWIVQNGMGTPTLDYIGCCCGWYFTIETKAKGQKLTPRQEKTAQSTEEADGVVFRIIGANDMAILELEAWLCAKTEKHYHAC